MVTLTLLPYDNPTNLALRPTILKIPYAQTLFRLNQPGDRRFAYAATQNSPLIIEVDYAPNIVPEAKLQTWLESMVQETLKKPARVIIETTPQIPAQNDYTHQELYTHAKAAQNPQLKSPSYLQLVYVNRSQDTPTNSGVVLTSETMFLFQDAMYELSTQSHIRDRLVESTIKHEWGHLLGLEHIDQEDCIMSETVEVYENRRFQATNIPTDYCPPTISALNLLLHQAN
jgi:hypothetical protein